MITRLNVLQLILLLSVFISVTASLKCKDTFCSRIRDGSQKPKSVSLDFGSSLKLEDIGVTTNMYIQHSSHPLKFSLEVIQNYIFHILIEEFDQPYRFGTEALAGKFSPSKIKAEKNSSRLVTVTNGDIKAVIHNAPFKIEFYKGNKLMSVVNSKNKFIFERQPNRGESAIALDVLFPDVQNAYGLPLHKDRLLLQTTTDSNNEPYRLYNINNDDKAFNTTQALHGSVPVLYAHGTKQSSGIFWLNPSQTWVDITKRTDVVESYFMSESGALEFYILPGPSLPAAVTQYAKLTGVAPLPPYFALGYHQSRYSLSQYDVAAAAEKFVLSNLPLDSIWLDMEYTDAKRYFTWDPKKYPRPYELLIQLEKYQVKLIAMINPHLKNDDSYPVHIEAKYGGNYIRNSNGVGSYSGKSLPGLSSWLDFLNQNTIEFYTKHLRNFEGFDHPNLHIWNDMNEPIEYNSVENTLPGSLLHYIQGEAVQHGDIHNMYGFFQSMATYSAMFNRMPRHRPFVLTSSHFAGSQRYTAVTTGNNVASWEDLRFSFSMCLAEALAGISFCGAYIGGFKGIPSTELYERWYQAGAWLPFYRGGFELNVPRREPYLYTPTTKHRVRKALRERYAHIPLWYWLFKEHELTGEPVIRPITYQYPEDTNAFDIDDEILVGPDVLVAPVFESNVNTRQVYLPGGESEIWYNINDNYNKSYGSIESQQVPYNYDSIPVFYRGGSIIARKDSESNSATTLCFDKYSLYISPDKDNRARGSFYHDDCDYFYGRFAEIDLEYSGADMSGRVVRNNGYIYPKIWKIVILHPEQKNINRISYRSYDGEFKDMMNVSYYNDGKSMEILFNDTEFGDYLEIKHSFSIKLVSSAKSLTSSMWKLFVIVLFTHNYFY